MAEQQEKKRKKEMQMKAQLLLNMDLKTEKIGKQANYVNIICIFFI